MSKFKVGEIAILAPHPSHTCSKYIGMYTGEECLITDALGSHHHPDGTPQYGVKFPNGSEWWIPELSLRKKPPPEQTETRFLRQPLSHWDDDVFKQLDWHPDKQKETAEVVGNIYENNVAQVLAKAHKPQIQAYCPVHWGEIHQDYTEVQKAEANLERAIKALQDYLEVMFEAPD